MFRLTRFLKGLNKKGLKEDARKFGINLMTGSIIGGFLSHLADMNWIVVLLLLWIGMLGLAMTLFGLYNQGGNDV